MPSRTLVTVIVASAVIGAAGCGSGGSSGSSAPGSTPPTTSTPVSSAPVSSAPTTTAAAPAAQNLVIDNKIRAELVAAGAALHKLTPKDYIGLIPGETYYAHVPAQGTYWAGGGLKASPNSIPAQVGDQDDGAYMVFERHGAGPWRAWETGIPGDSHFTCPVKVPAAVLEVWQWTPGTCHPPSSPD